MIAVKTMEMAKRVLLSLLSVSVTASAQAPCQARVKASHDFSYLVGSAGPSGNYRWLVNGKPVQTGRMSQVFMLHAEESVVAAAGQNPVQATRISYQPGRWGWGLALEPSGDLAYAREGNLDLDEGTVEMWVAPRADGADPIYSQRDHILFFYRAPNGDQVSIAQSRTSGILYAGGSVGGQWQSAYGGAASMRGWRAGEWHHLAYTYSAAENRMRFYVDGVLTADTNEKRYQPPSPAGDRFAVGGNLSGATAHYFIDEVRIWSRVMDATEIRANAERLDQPADNEVWLPVAGLAPGDQVVFEYGSCASKPFVWVGIPLADPDPPSTLLPPQTTTLPFSVRTIRPASCGYSVGTPLNYDSMRPFESGQETTAHQTIIAGLDADPTRVSDVYVRCSSDPDYLLRLKYRSLGRVNPPFPRKGNLWGSSGAAQQGLAHAARIDLYLGASFSPSEIRQLRTLNPNILVLTSINTVENFGLPDDYYLKDVHGKRIEVWPGTYRLNLTKRYVAEHQARYAYQRILDSGLMVDGCFFDNFFTSQAWLRADIHGNRVQLDANEDGVEDDPAWLDAAWREGVFYELELWRKLMPHALASGHLPRPPGRDVTAIFNGDSIGFWTADVLEGKKSFVDLWDFYHDWFSTGRTPVIMMTESSPPDQIAYGYDYSPLKNIPPSTLEFARTYYPYVRFGLAFTLMNDGYFAHEFGDTWHGNDWWYDELDYELGYPLGPAVREPLGVTSTANRIDNGSFEEPLEGAWSLYVNTSVGCAATAARDSSEAMDGRASALITITSAGQRTDWHVDFAQRNLSLVGGVRYDLSFWAKADVTRPMGLASQKGSPDWRNYGLSRTVTLSTEWRQYLVSFEANETTNESRIQFFMGAQTGRVWLDDVRLVDHPPDVFRREFTNGVVLLNGTRERQTVKLGPGYNRLRGEQAPRHEYILDDDGLGFSTTGQWQETVYDSGEWKSAGPFYHNWGKSCHQLNDREGKAEWDLALRADDTYTIAAWWPAAPSASAWSRRVVYEVVAGGKVVAATTLDQTSGGDEWHVIASLPLAAADKPVVRVRNEGDGPTIADALHVRSAARYNDGSPAAQVTLEPLDGIILAKSATLAGTR